MVLDGEILGFERGWNAIDEMGICGGGFGREAMEEEGNNWASDDDGRRRPSRECGSRRRLGFQICGQFQCLAWRFQRPGFFIA